MTTKTVFTTGEAAKICKVSQQTIIRCFDNGSLKGSRVPGSKFRRIPREQLYLFMKDNGIPTDGYLLLGLYRPEDGQRLPAHTEAGERLPDDAIRIDLGDAVH